MNLAPSEEKHNPQSSQPAEIAAAVIIQRLWRSRNNRAKQRYLTTDTRWQDAIAEAEFEGKRDEAQEGQNSASIRWRRAIFLVKRLVDHDLLVASNGVHAESQDVESKELEAQHWLELIDRKHRYGSNLKWYHRKWQEDDTKDNFFRWLDHGAGRNLDLSDCPRERLEKERIIYLSAEQRLNYLVDIGKDGKLYWAKNGLPVDTSAGRWKDAGDGAGIVPKSLPSGVEQLNAPERMMLSREDDPNDDASSKQLGDHYVGDVGGKNRLSRFFKNHFTIPAIVNKVLRKTTEKNTWMYISDRNFNIFVGIKETGSFQHSSFLAGGLVTSAGLIKVKDGVVHTLSPLSGHYRTSVDHFRQFVDALNERKVDMSKVHIGKEEVVLRGVENFGKAKKKEAKAMKTVKDTMKDAAKSAAHPSQWKRDEEGKADA